MFPGPEGNAETGGRPADLVGAGKEAAACQFRPRAGGPGQSLLFFFFFFSFPSSSFFLLLMDEPTEGISAQHHPAKSDALIEQLRAEGEMAIVLVEQYFDFAFDLADRFYVLSRGATVFSAEKADTNARRGAGRLQPAELTGAQRRADLQDQSRARGGPAATAARSPAPGAAGLVAAGAAGAAPRARAAPSRATTDNAKPAAYHDRDGLELVQFQPLAHRQRHVLHPAIRQPPAPVVAVVADEGPVAQHRQRIVLRPSSGQIITSGSVRRRTQSSDFGITKGGRTRMRAFEAAVSAHLPVRHRSRCRGSRKPTVDPRRAGRPCRVQARAAREPASRC